MPPGQSGPSAQMSTARRSGASMSSVLDVGHVHFAATRELQIASDGKTRDGLEMVGSLCAAG